MPISESDARRFVTDVAGSVDPLAGVVAPSTEAAVLLPEVQNAIRAATESADSAIGMGRLMNRFLKLSDGKSNQGRWVPSAVDSLRSALLFACAGLDTSLKQLVRSALPVLANSDAAVDRQFQKWAEQRIAGDDGTVQARGLIRILLTTGNTPRDSLLSGWVYDLTSGSAQSVERVSELAQALGVDDSVVRKRCSPGNRSSLLSLAFEARNQIAHELDVNQPKAEVRKRLESIREYRKESFISSWCSEVLDITQTITNHVAGRM